MPFLLTGNNHRHYYPRPVTYGFAVRYNPHTGNWGFRFGYHGEGGWFVGGAYRRGWWGAGGYRDIDIDINRNINIDRSRNNIYNRRRDVARRPVTGRPSVGRPGVGRPGVGKPRVGRPATKPSTKPKRQNDLYAGLDGSVHRKTDKGWQKHDRSGWSQQKRPDTQLERHNSARQRGANRTNYYNRSRSSGGRPAGGRRGGGRGRRR